MYNEKKDGYRMKFDKTEILEDTGGFKEADEVLRLALDVGGEMLKAGGEISRVEDTIIRICKAYGAEHVEIFAIPSLMVAAVRMKNGAYSSQIRRVYGTENNLHKVEIFNAISRDICESTPDFDEVDRMVREAKRKKSYPMWVRVLAASVVASGFAILFGGDVWDGLVAAIIGAIIYVVDMIPIDRINRLAKLALQSFLGGLLACLSVKIGAGHDLAMIMIGTIMLLVPGLSFNTALRDLLCGDLLAGTLKTVQCVLAALMIAAGYLLAMVLVGGVA